LSRQRRHGRSPSPGPAWSLNHLQPSGLLSSLFVTTVHPVAVLKSGAGKLWSGGVRHARLPPRQAGSQAALGVRQPCACCGCCGSFRAWRPPGHAPLGLQLIPGSMLLLLLPAHRPGDVLKRSILVLRLPSGMNQQHACRNARSHLPGGRGKPFQLASGDWPRLSRDHGQSSDAQSLRGSGPAYAHSPSPGPFSSLSGAQPVAGDQS